MNPAIASLRKDWALALRLLREGDYVRGFELYETRRKAPAFRNLAFPEWSGQDLDGKTLLVWPEQGFGDQIQCARFLPILAGMGAKVVAVTEKPLLRLLSGLGVDLIERQPAVALPRIDFYTMLFSIPYHLGVTQLTIPATPYLSGVARGGAARVGVVTRGNPAFEGDTRRSLPDDAAKQLLALPGAMSLLPDDTGARDFQDTADLISGLELVISVDTSVAHLAGAMGKPVWIMLPAVNTDWRWMEGRSDSPWYPTARLFRQAPDEAWSTLTSRIVASLQSTS